MLNVSSVTFILSLVMLHLWIYQTSSRSSQIIIHLIAFSAITVTIHLVGYELGNLQKVASCLNVLVLSGWMVFFTNDKAKYAKQIKSCSAGLGIMAFITMIVTL